MSTPLVKIKSSDVRQYCISPTQCYPPMWR